MSSCRMELIKVVGERGVSTGEASPPRTGHVPRPGLDGSSFTLTDWFVLERVSGGQRSPCDTFIKTHDP